MALSVGFVGEAFSQVAVRATKLQSASKFRDVSRDKQLEFLRRANEVTNMNSPFLPQRLQKVRQEVGDISMRLLNLYVNRLGVSYKTLVASPKLRQALLTATELGPPAISAVGHIGVAASKASRGLQEKGYLTDKMTELLVEVRNRHLELVTSLRNSEQIKAVSSENINTFFKELFEAPVVDQANMSRSSIQNAIVERLQRGSEMQIAFLSEIKAGKPLAEARDAAIERVMANNSELAQRLKSLTREEFEAFRRRCVGA